MKSKGTKIRSYFLITTVTFLLIMFNQLLIQYWLAQKDSDARIINLAGRQRAISQKIVVYCVKEKEKASYHNVQELSRLIQTWRASHNNLLYGNKKLQLPTAKDFQIIKRLKDLNKNIVWIESNQKKLLYIPILEIIKNQNEYLTTMEKVVSQFEDISENKLFKIKILELVLAIFTILIIIIEFIYFSKPIIHQLERQKTETDDMKIRLDAILNSSTDSNILIDFNFKILSFNKVASEHIFSIVGRQPKIGDDMLMYVSGDKDNSFKESFELCFKGNTIQVEKELFIAKGVKKWYEITYFPVRDNNDNLIGAAFNAKNIDLKKQHEAQIHAQIEHLKKIAWQHSHELRSPLTNILGLSTLLKKKGQELSSSEVQIFVEKISDSAEKVDQIIHSIVDEIESKN